MEHRCGNKERWKERRIRGGYDVDGEAMSVFTCTSIPDWERRSCILGPRCPCKQFSLIRENQISRWTKTREMGMVSRLSNKKCPSHLFLFRSFKTSQVTDDPHLQFLSTAMFSDALLILPRPHATEWLICHVLSVVAPLPLIALPIIHASDPDFTSCSTTLDEILPQKSVCHFQWLCKLCIFILALEVRIQPAGFGRRQVITFVANFGEARWTHSVYSSCSCKLLNLSGMMSLLMGLLMRLLRVSRVNEEEN